jgi:hypothetical protein
MILQRLFSLRWVLATLMLSAFLQSDITIVKNTAVLDYPGSIAFHLEATSPTEITSAQLEVRTDALACGQSATRIVPDDFTPGKSITVDWTWELRRTGALPPGTTVWWRWTLQEAGGGEFETPEEQLTIEDDSHTWQQIESKSLVLHWYDGSQDFAQTLLAAGQATIDRLEENIGTADDQPIRVYVYPSPEEMQSATLFAPSWSGGLAFTDHSALLLAVGSGEEDWGKRVISHELTHIVVGRYVFSCVTSMPIWFNEGFAMYSEGEPEAYYVSLLNTAIKDDDLLSVRELGQIFSNDPSMASLSYAESQSLVSFLIEKYGEDKIPLLLDRFKEGATEDRALEEVYGFDRDGLEAAWREWIGAAPMKSTTAGPITTMTPYPTFAPIVEPPEAAEEVRPTPQYLATLSPGVEPVPATAADPLAGVERTLVIGVIVVVCMGAAALTGVVVVIILLVRRQRRMTEEQ